MFVWGKGCREREGDGNAKEIEPGFYWGWWGKTEMFSLFYDLY